MPNMIDFARRCAGQTFHDLPFGEVDQAILCQLVHLPLQLALPAPGAAAAMSALSAGLRGVAADKVYEVLLRARLRLLHICGESARYGALPVSGFVDEISDADQKQFCAMTVSLPDQSRAVCFRGTDLTLAGWKEDFNMAFDEPTPAQRRAVAYIAERADGPLIVAGHSKGGNLAVYGSAFCGQHAQRHITRVYTNDGPGLSPERVASDAYRAIAPRILSLLPQNSLVGVLLSHHEPYQVVYSRAVGILEHNPFSWDVEQDANAFVRRRALSRTSQVMDAALDGWLARMPLDDRRAFADTLYGLLTASETRTLGELVKNPLQSAERMLRARRNLSGEARRVLRRCIAGFFSAGAEAIAGRMGLGPDGGEDGPAPPAGRG